MRIRFIVNPTAGKGRAKKRWERLAPYIRSRACNYDVTFTDGPGCATRLASEAAEKGYDRVVSVGGDGTTLEVANGLIGSDTALALLPSGTGNDLPKSLNIPENVQELVELILHGPERPIDVGCLSNGRYFLNMVSVGCDAEVAAAANRFPIRMGGSIPYIFGTLQTFITYSPAPVEIEIDGTKLHRKILLLAVGNGMMYGGGVKVTPDAKLDDGLFDVCIGGDLSRIEAIRLLPSFLKGKHTMQPKIEMRRCRSISVYSKCPLIVQADGEIMGELPVELTVLPRKLQVVAPPAAISPDYTCSTE